MLTESQLGWPVTSVPYRLSDLAAQRKVASHSDAHRMSKAPGYEQALQQVEHVPPMVEQGDTAIAITSAL